MWGFTLLVLEKASVRLVQQGHSVQHRVQWVVQIALMGLTLQDLDPPSVIFVLLDHMFQVQGEVCVQSATLGLTLQTVECQHALLAGQGHIVLGQVFLYVQRVP